MHIKHLIALGLALPCLAFAGAGNSVSAGNPHVRQPPPNAPAAGAFMTLRNTGATEVRLVAASSPAAGRAELHTHRHEDGMMKMRRIEAIAIRAGGEAVLQPGGLHVMLMDLKSPLGEGDVVPLELQFDDGSSLRVDAPVVRPATGMQGAGGH
ncbi:copper chaperone PCu(A)C [Pseudothauera rhizosphaerae]|nr:copper chaperone PCu(A)C [Pseudothauera rhizosphaerae]